MTVTIPAQDRTGAYQKQAEITTLAAVATTAPHYQQAQQRLLQSRNELVNTLVAQGKLSAATLLSTTSVFNSGKVPANSALPILGTIAAYSVANDPSGAKAAQLAAYRQQAVSELLANGLMSAALVLSTQSYGGGAAM